MVLMVLRDHKASKVTMVQTELTELTQPLRDHKASKVTMVQTELTELTQ